jgi:hypothetical protein
MRSGFMGSLEEKIARLSPEQRREVENFVDFVARKNNSGGTPTPEGTFFQETPAEVHANPIILAEEVHVRKSTEITEPLPVLEEQRAKDIPPEPRRESPQREDRFKKKDPGLLLDWID